MDINNKLLWLYRNIGDGDVDVLNYDKNQKQTDFGNNLKDFLILITKNPFFFLLSFCSGRIASTPNLLVSGVSGFECICLCVCVYCVACLQITKFF